MNEIPVLFENDSCFILNKPAGLPVQGGEGVKVSLDSILSENFLPRPLLVHRLDRDTSGIILVAKTREAAAGFSALFTAGNGNGGNAFAKRTVIKQYLGIGSGIPAPERGEIRLDLDVRPKNQNKGRGAITSKKSVTYYRLLSAGSTALPDQGSTGTDRKYSFSLLELELGTGRMHQIRLHLAHIGHPLLGDDKYGDFTLNKLLRKAMGLKHLLLHASRLVLPSLPGLAPGGLDIRAPLPDYFQPLLDVCRLQINQP